MEVVLVDSPVANVANIQRALTSVGANVTLTADPARIAAAGKVVLPGVGSFAAAMRWLDSSGAGEAVRSAASAGAWLLGICVGHQVLFDDSDEDGQWHGLGILSGSVRRFAAPLPVPQIGWNRVETTNEDLFAGIADRTPFYFVNSYRAADAPAEIASSEYGGRFTAAARAGRTFGVQFHPEKSSDAGLRLLGNFVKFT
ncbi:MAG: imidazole glycerol phosphate synthase subunit HisH [Thermoanaerobaculia bacterium]